MTGSATSHHQPSEPVQTWCESVCSSYFIVAWHCGVWNLAVSGRFQHQDHMSVKQIHGSQSAGCDGFSLFIAFPNREKTSCWNDGAHRTLSLIHGDKNFWRTVQGATPAWKWKPPSYLQPTALVVWPRLDFFLCLGFIFDYKLTWSSVASFIVWIWFTCWSLFEATKPNIWNHMFSYGELWSDHYQLLSCFGTGLDAESLPN